MKTENTEQEILQAAEAEFLEKGYAGAKTTAIAQRAGVNHAMLHYYFRTKENLFNRVFEEKVKLLTQSLFPVFGNPDKPFLQRVEDMISRHFDFIIENPNLPRFVINEIVSSPEKKAMLQEKLKSVFPLFCHAVQQEIDQLADKGVINRIPAIDLIIDIVSLNIFVFTIFPVLGDIICKTDTDKQQFLHNRKQENISIIMSRLKYKAPL